MLLIYWLLQLYKYTEGAQFICKEVFRRSAFIYALSIDISHLGICIYKMSGVSTDDDISLFSFSS